MGKLIAYSSFFFMITAGRSSLCKGLCGESSCGELLRRIYSRTPSYTNKCRGKRLYSAFRPSALVGPTLQQALSGAVRAFGSRRFTCRNSCKETKVPSIDKGRYGFDGQKCAHTASSPLTIQQVFSVGLFLSGHISAPAKLLRTRQRCIFE